MCLQLLRILKCFWLKPAFVASITKIIQYEFYSCALRGKKMRGKKLEQKQTSEVLRDTNLLLILATVRTNSNSFLFMTEITATEQFFINYFESWLKSGVLTVL